MQTYTKEGLKKRFKEIKDMGWISEGRQGNQGSAGNTLEDLLGVSENNLPIPNAAEWELKTHKLNSSALLTLLHSEPSPNALRLVPNYLLPNFGWPHKEAGKKYSLNEKSFRQTLNSTKFTNRGFKIEIDDEEEKIKLVFDPQKITLEQQLYKKMLEKSFDKSIEKISIPKEKQPYWGFTDLFHKMGIKLTNSFFVEYKERKTANGKEFSYEKVTMLQNFKIENFLHLLNNDLAYVDFDARTGHNHGTKFRIKSNHMIDLYDKVTPVI
ncbi:hypothetical protein TEHD10_2232 [Tetragenococcus halophilus subsp. halophilus]|uniref:MvaI/BcnI family restriction endonuclease n=1 Tax=Tetragenococcus halophilus TaxID=51669 RepID=UPI000CB9F277|nr:MvaI/BcnI family restriction endonuclease [Tetragenococcus halophilus]GBD81169.1 hypothetical protein TEHD10_2232 [Tetragenococcus halophilus subsp. halophilus]